MTNNKLTDEQLAVFTKPPTNWPCPGSAGDIMSMAAELQEYRKAALEMRALITSELCDFFAGLEQPGAPEGAQAMQSELMSRLDIALAGCLVAPKFDEEF